MKKQAPKQRPDADAAPESTANDQIKPAGIVATAMAGLPSRSFEELALAAAELISDDVPRLAKLDPMTRRRELLQWMRVVSLHATKDVTETLADFMTKDETKRKLKTDIHRMINTDAKEHGRVGASRHRKNRVSEKLRAFADTQTDLVKLPPLRRAEEVLVRAERCVLGLEDLKSHESRRRLLYRHFLAKDKLAREKRVEESSRK